jgi:hypothetical protein
MSIPPLPPSASIEASRPEDFGFQLLIRDRLDRETDLVIQRTAWVVGSQAFLFSAYAVALTSPLRAGPADIAAKSRLLVRLIPWVSIVCLILLLLTIGAGIVASVYLRRHAERADPRAKMLDAGPMVRVAGLAAPLLVPVAFLMTWLVLVAYR